MTVWRTEPSPPPQEPASDAGDVVEREFIIAALAGTQVCPDYGKAPWPAAYQDRLRVLDGQLDALAAVLKPLYAAHRAFEELGGGQRQSDGPDATREWKLPAGASLWIQAGFKLHVGVGAIGAGVVPAPDPVMCLASALCNAEQWGSTMAVFAEAALWAVEQAREWSVSVPGFD